MTLDTDVSFGVWIRQRRRALDLSQDALAKRVGCARITIQKIEAGERHPSREFAAVLAEQLAVPPDKRGAFLQAARTGLTTLYLGDSNYTTSKHVSDARAHAAHPAAGAGNIPARVTPCIGRERELAQLAGLLTDPACRLITLVGPGGAGKSFLALEVAAAHAVAFRDGAWLVALGDEASSELVVTAITNALGVMCDPAGDRIEQLAFFLRDKQLLLVLDSVEHAVHVTGVLLAQLLRAAPGLKAIVTSRERLRLQGEWLIELEGLTYPPVGAEDSARTWGAVELFLQLARMVRPDFVLRPDERSHVVRLCRLLEGLPLAIELAAGWLRLRSCQALADQIAQGLDVSALAPRDLPERQRSLHAVFDYSWNLLDEPQRAALRRLAVFHTPFDSAAAESVAGVPQAVLAALLDKSLLRRGDDERYALHDLVRRYAADRLASAGDEQEQTLARHATYFAAVAGMHSAAVAHDVPAQTMAELRAVYLDMRAAWEWALARYALVLVSQMLDCLWGFCMRQSLFLEGLDLLGRAVLAFEAEELAATAARQLVNRLRVRQAIFYQRLALTEQARLLLHRAVVAAREMGNLPEVALCLEELAGGAFTAGAYGEAQHYYEEALDLRTTLGDEPAASMSRSMLGLIAHDRGDYVVAREYCQAAVATASRAGSPRWLVAETSMRLSYVEYALGNYQTARALAEKALAELSRAGWSYGMVHMYSALALILAAEGEYAAAERMLRDALGRARSINYPFGTALVLNHLGYVLSRQGASAEAEDLLHEALVLCRAAQNRIGVAYALVRLGEVACARGDNGRGEHYLLEALQTARAIEVVPLMLDALFGLALAAARRQDSNAALRFLALPLVHAACRAVTRARAAQLYAGLKSQLPAAVAEQALHETQAIGMVKFVDALL